MGTQFLDHMGVSAQDQAKLEGCVKVTFMSLEYKGPVGSLTAGLPANTTALMKGSVDTQVFNLAKAIVHKFIQQCVENHHGPAAAPVKPPLSAMDTVEASAEAFTDIKPKPSKKPVSKAQAMIDGAKPVKLSEATNIGQPIKGSSGGSVYYCVGISEAVAIAMRRKGNKSISLRVEPRTEFPPNVRQTLISNGFQDHGHYMSVHVDQNGLSPTKSATQVARVMGAIYMSVPVTWTGFADTPMLSKVGGV